MELATAIYNRLIGRSYTSGCNVSGDAYADLVVLNVRTILDLEMNGPQVACYRINHKAEMERKFKWLSGDT